jgi:LacI family transcriptional regulator
MKTGSEITIYDVAKKLNLSPSTISRGLRAHPHINKETANRIKAAAEEMGYQQNKFASNLRLKRTNTLGLVVPRLNSYFMSAVISGIEKVTNSNKYGLIISTSQESARLEKSSVFTLFNSRVDGIMVSLASDTSDLEHFNVVFRKNIPVVFFDRVIKREGCLSVMIDNYRAAYETTAHLIQQGCRRIVHIGGNLMRNVYNDRFEGYRRALADNGIKFSKDLVFIGDLSRAAGTETAKSILKIRPLPDGIFTSNDTSAVSVIIELLKAGLKIPQDICVAGFNNEPISEVIQPNLTSVNYPAGEIGEIVASSLIETLKNNSKTSADTILLDHQLIIRESSLRIK